MADVVIVGKPNVGKSRIFNRLVKKRKAIVDDVPGVTRDVIRDVVRVDEGYFNLIDTGGIFESAPKESIERIVKEKVLEWIEKADLVLFVVDGRNPPTSEDFQIAETLRKYKDRVMLVANKVENDRLFEEIKPEIYSLGFGDPIPISAEHGRNIDLLLDAIVERLTELGVDLDVEMPMEEAIKVAIVGKPNAGKSSIFNAIIGEERAIVTPIPGTTRDSIDELVEIDGKKYLFIDTAGLRRRSRVEPGSIERYGNYRSVEAIERADVVVLVVDTLEGITRQDQRLAGLAERRGKATVVVFNKWDLVDHRDERMEDFEAEFREKLYFVDYSPLIFTSAVRGWGIDELIEAIDLAYSSYTTKVPTSRLNSALERLLMVSPPPSKKGKKLRIYFGMQVDVKPPTFLFFSNRPSEIPKSYVRLLQRMIREQVFPFEGSPVFIKFKKSRK